MKQVVLSGMAAFGLFMGVADGARADSANCVLAGVAERLQDNPATTVTEQTHGPFVHCANGNRAQISTSDPARAARFQSMALAAFLSGRNFYFECASGTVSTSGTQPICFVTAWGM